MAGFVVLRQAWGVFLMPTLAILSTPLLTCAIWFFHRYMQGTVYENHSAMSRMLALFLRLCAVTAVLLAMLIGCLHLGIMVSICALLLLFLYKYPFSYEMSHRQVMWPLVFYMTCPIVVIAYVFDRAAGPGGMHGGSFILVFLVGAYLWFIGSGIEHEKPIPKDTTSPAIRSPRLRFLGGYQKK
jgi:hypothetical protein